MFILTYSGEADSNGCSLADMFEHLGLAVTSYVMSDFKIAKSPYMKKKKITCLYQETYMSLIHIFVLYNSVVL